ncbi:MAG: hypothetical protein QGG48_10155 [Desulfatiglandales bacterium]|nr:hypothetical protein [Desulfatiglandales bacterium]
MKRLILSILLAMPVNFAIHAKGHQILEALGLKKGMDRETVKKIIGDPKRVANQNPCRGIEEHWWHERKELTDKVILFTDGKLDQIETKQGKK